MNNLKVIEHKQQRVLTTAQLAESYGTESNTVLKNFQRNKERYNEETHYYQLTGETLKNFKLTTGQIDDSSKINSLYLWTEKGALLHAKSLNTDKAWQVYEMLVDNYFRMKEQPKQQMLPQNYIEALEQLITAEKENLNDVNIKIFDGAVLEIRALRSDADIIFIDKIEDAKFLKQREEINNKLDCPY